MLQPMVNLGALTLRGSHSIVKKQPLQREKNPELGKGCEQQVYIPATVVGLAFEEGPFPREIRDEQL